MQSGLLSLRHALRPRRDRVPQRRADLLVSACFWLLLALYAATFGVLSLRRYDAFMMHALDMGNMQQAVWNTLHGHPFRFTNMRQHLRIEAFGTDTRLSFHVEPIVLPLSLLQIFDSGPKALLLLQTLVLASGAIPARRLARRHLAPSRFAELAFPCAYLLFPALQAANLYEFHPVTLTAALLLWALDAADQPRPVPFVLFGVAALCCKEEIGLAVALMALWSIRRGMNLRLAVLLAAGCVTWSMLAVLAIIPAAEHAEHSTVASSPYLTRYLAPGALTPGQYVHATLFDVLKYWAQHPESLVDDVLSPSKVSYVQRLLAPAGYLSLLNPLTLLILAPGFLLIVLSNDPHMYGGVGHYSAELVGIVIAAAIIGLATAAGALARCGLVRHHVINGGCALLCILSIANTRVNGFSPLSSSFEWPALTRHTALAERMLSMIPPAASVSAQDTLNPHLSDRSSIFLFPDDQDAEYVALDVSVNPIPSKPSVMHATVDAMLKSRRWSVLFADDGLLLLRRSAGPSRSVPALPPAFYSFALPDKPAIAHLLQAAFGPGLELLGYTLTKKEVVNLRVPNVEITTYWRATKRQSRPLSILTSVTDADGQVTRMNGEQMTSPWLPVTSWPVGKIVAVSSTDNGIEQWRDGTRSACIGVVPGVELGEDPGTGLPISAVQSEKDSESYTLHFDRRVLCAGAIHVEP